MDRRSPRHLSPTVSVDDLGNGDVSPFPGSGWIIHFELSIEQTGTRRTEGQRGAVALLQLVAKGSARSDGSQPDPLIDIVMSESVAEDILRRLTEPDGCDAPYPWIQIDHDQPWSKGGVTAYRNANVFCRADNLAKGDR
ncbi:MAG: HNH endonuclease signature motif containing protein [Actinomycetota bacterium]